jgi:hypothetical protein
MVGVEEDLPKRAEEEWEEEGGLYSREREGNNQGWENRFTRKLVLGREFVRLR